MNELECVIAARIVLDNPNRYIILDTETTGLFPCEAVQIAIIDLSGKTLLNSLIKPTRKITPGAADIHGITEKTVANAPTFKDIYEQIKSIITNKVVLIYNADFDSEVLDLCCEVYGLPKFKYEELCIMHLYSEFVGEWNDYHQNNKWQRLPGGDHTALGDCLATLDVIKVVASSAVNEAELAAIINNRPPF
jgi:DNA polymerase-3 subunit epsilon